MIWGDHLSSRRCDLDRTYKPCVNYGLQDVLAFQHWPHDYYVLVTLSKEERIPNEDDLRTV